MANLFDPVTLGDIQMTNRVVMAPMTRSRAGAGDVPTELAVEYYRQRATAGLIITEGVQPSPVGKGYCRTPGIYGEAHVEAWSKVAAAVHAEGGRLVMQIMHVGRVAHPDNKGGVESVAPSAVPARAEIFTETGMKPMVTPRALESREIPGVIEQYRQAAARALAAGCDGVEMHCASGYLPAQFLSTGTNHRTDRYGGCLGNRICFVMETLQAMASVAGPGKVGFRICPGNPFNDLQDDNPEETFTALLQAADKLGLAYCHVIRMSSTGLDNIKLVKDNFGGRVIVNDSYTSEEADQVIRSGVADAVSFGRYYVANPDLVRRFRHNLPLAQLNPKTLYTPGPEGYLDYPAL
jgi:N-ethylmaleimide reductase